MNYVNQKNAKQQDAMTPEEFIDLFGEFCDTLGTLADYAARLYQQMTSRKAECSFCTCCCVGIEECDDEDDEECAGIQIEVSDADSEISTDVPFNAGVHALLIDPRDGCFFLPIRAALEFLGGFGDDLELKHLDNTITLGYNKSTVADCGDEKYVTGPMIAMKNRSEIEDITKADAHKLYETMRDLRNTKIRKNGKNIPAFRME